MFMRMRKSDVYSFKRQSMKLQYEILALGLKSDMQQGLDEKAKLNASDGDRHDRSMFDDQEGKNKYGSNERKSGIYSKFATYFVNEKENLKDVM